MTAANGVGTLGSNVAFATIDSFGTDDSGDTVRLPWGFTPVASFAATNASGTVKTATQVTLTPVDGSAGEYVVALDGVDTGAKVTLVIFGAPNSTAKW